MNFLLHEEAAAGGAALAAVEVDRVERTSYRAIEVAVGEDHVGAFAAEFECRAFERVCGLFLDDFRGVDVAREGDFVDVRVADDGCACGFAEAVDHVDDAGRKAGFGGELGHAHRGDRRLLGGLHDDRVAAGEGRAPFHGEHQEREVPGDDLADHADGLAERVGEEVAADGDRAALDFVGPAAVVFEEVRDALDVAERVAEDLAAVERFEFRELLGVFLDEFGEFEEESAAVGGVHLFPGGGIEGVAGGFDGAVDVGRVTLGDAAEFFAGRGVERREGLAARRRGRTCFR